jgi:hypothetical protein
MSEGKRPVGRPKGRGLHNVKNGTEQGLAQVVRWAAQCRHGSKYLGFIECGELHDYLRSYYSLLEDCAHLSWMISQSE